MVKNVSMRVCLSAVLLSAAVDAAGQPTLFSEEALERGIIMVTDHNYWGAGVSFHDWDRDGWPDLTLCRTGMTPAFYHNDGGTFSPVAFNIPNTHEAKCILWADYDNDGDADLLITRFMGPWSLYRNNGSFMFTDVTDLVGITQAYNAQTMGASWADIDNDGHLDFYVCNYNWGDTVTNYLFRSNGDGTFTEVGAEVGAHNGVNITFQSAFLDMNMDGWPDLHVSNDRNASPNAMLLNKGDGTFEDISASSGMDFAIDAMSNTVGDYDNDGDLDIYVSNHVAGNRLMRNNGDSTFTNVASSSGVAVHQVSWAALWLDHDLNGWQDLFVCTSPLYTGGTIVPNHFYSNNADGTFTYRSDSGMEGVISRSYCAATADFDNDGAPDIAISNKHPHMTELWRNTSMGHSYIKVSLRGTVSNRDGIGATVRCHANGVTQLRYAQCGQAHFGQDSQYLLFGLDGAAGADSITVHWPSGTVDALYGPAAGQLLMVEEGSSQITVGMERKDGPSAPFVLIGRELIPSAGRDFTFVLIDMLGRQLVRDYSTGGRRTDLSAFAPGCHVVRWMGSDGASGAERVWLR